MLSEVNVMGNSHVQTCCPVPLTENLPWSGTASNKMGMTPMQTKHHWDGKCCKSSLESAPQLAFAMVKSAAAKVHQVHTLENQIQASECSGDFKSLGAKLEDELISTSSADASSTSWPQSNLLQPATPA